LLVKVGHEHLWRATVAHEHTTITQLAN
jgi:hypothetical protein